MPTERRDERAIKFYTRLAYVVVLITFIGATRVRPLADDYKFESHVASAGGYQTFLYWMRTWSGYYSHFGILSGGVAVFRRIGLDVYFFAAASICLIVLMLGVAQLISKSWMGNVAPKGAAFLITAGMLGSFASLRLREAPFLFGALYWASAWMGRLVPLLILPIGLNWSLRSDKRLRASCGAAVTGFLIGGFGFAEGVTALAATLLVMWAVRRLKGSAEFRRRLPVLIVLAATLAVGLVISLAAPGTAARATAIQADRGGVFLAPGLAANVGRLLKILGSDLLVVLFSPAAPLGLIMGWGLRRALPNSAETVDNERTRVTIIVLSLLFLVEWLTVGIGDLTAYQAWWHLLPCFVLVFFLAAASGWSIGERLIKGAGAPWATAMAVALAWCLVLTGVVAKATFDRARVIDGNLAAVRAVITHRRPPPIVWRSMRIANLPDLETSPADGQPWRREAIQTWLGIPSSNQLVAQQVSPPLFTIPLPTGAICRRLYICGDL